MPSEQSVQLRSYLLTQKTATGEPVSLAERRLAYERSVETYVGHPIPLPEGMRVEPIDVDGVPAEWLSPAVANTNAVLLYLHGGAYILGSPASHRDLVARLSVAAGIPALLINYRLAPEHVFPAALDDALTAYHWLLSKGYSAQHIVLAGDSAGGGLTLALLQTVRDRNLPLPAAAALISPWTDLAGTVKSRSAQEAVDPIFSGDTINALAHFYAGAENLSNPLLSPIYADLHGFPPLRIDVGRDEVLLDDSLLIAEHARAAAVPVELTVWDDMWHVFQAYAAVLPEGQQSLAKMGSFLRQTVLPQE
ncbi:alpha/beta hydrolase [Dictyobacter aurantiacus]|uniref:Hydrolase n=1 Tax=Dictyobacter aurantiacus TaxID=1936993 RepID=A0A401ZN34_9CHLR|nr:alpha/beta hydrolase [Dictyobacter aurantiacus]GCE08220.1 hydrolase [Dictyobacter aurantiacus]